MKSSFEIVWRNFSNCSTLPTKVRQFGKLSHGWFEVFFVWKLIYDTALRGLSTLREGVVNTSACLNYLKSKWSRGICEG